MKTKITKYNLQKTLFCLLGFISCYTTATAAPDTLRLMHYNLLNYGNVTPSSYKNPRLTTIVNYVRPDILEVNELGNNASYSQDILNNVLGTGWEKGTYSNTGNEVQTNMVFWRSSKLALKQQTVISHILRDIIAFKLYYKDSNLATTHDTIFVTVITCHLKAGSTAQDSLDRSQETATVATWLSTAPAGNYVMMGDMNLYTSAEKAYQNLVNNTTTSARLYDPIAKPGNWHSSASFATIHTQSTRTTSLSDGGATGGLDDRFDHIIVSEGIMNNTYKARYLSQTYKTIGQDGLHRNASLIASPTNTSAPANVIQALYEMSDHLPVSADLLVTPTIPTSPPPSSVAYYSAAKNRIQIVNTPNGETGFIPGTGFANQPLQVSIYSTDGKLVSKTTTIAGEAGNLYSISTGHLLANNLYLVAITNQHGYTITSKIYH